MTMLINTSRTLVIPADPLAQMTMTLRFPQQEMDSILDYYIDCHNVVDYDDSIVSLVITSAPTDLTITNLAFASTYPDNCTAGFEAAGSSNGTDHELDVKITFASGRVYECTAFLLVGQVGQTSTVTGTITSPSFAFILEGGGGYILLEGSAGYLLQEGATS